MATYTENFGLHQWVPEDDFLRTDFNHDFQKIDEAIRAVADTAGLVADKCEPLTGVFTGDGEPFRDIELGVAPRAVFLVNRSTMDIYLATEICAMGSLLTTETGFRTGVNDRTDQQNKRSVSYLYLALV